MCGVIPLGCESITVIIPRWGPRSQRIILDVRFKIPDAEMSNIVCRLEGRVRKARAQSTRELRKGMASVSIGVQEPLDKMQKLM